MKNANIRKKIFVCIFSANFLFVFLPFLSNQVVFAKFPQIEAEKNNSFFLQNFLRTELYFGMNKKNGSVVTEEEWNQFLTATVTPRFPQGFTSLQATGQYQILSGIIVRENSRVLIFLYPLNKRKASNRKIEQIRSLYKQKFLQESVLRLDFPQTVRVSF